ncbi:MAG: hypothetical protein Q7J73_00665 [Dehalococcoidales bacterium]|nr:hypothetical protein [Dehalococcoidales bacterium]
MKTRLQLAIGWMSGTLTPEEEEAALANPVVFREIESMKMEYMNQYDGGESELKPAPRKKGKKWRT